MSNFANLSANLNLNIQDFAKNMNKAAGMMNQFSAKYSGTLNSGEVGKSTKSQGAFKDPSRIVQGILVSKLFYGVYQTIRNATGAVLDFSKELQYAGMVYTNLFQDAALAKEFINVLKDFAATTPFTFKQSEEAAKRLLAYGIQAKNVMYVMQGVLAASTVQNNPQSVESISRALGQIYTKGRLMNEEMRQLAEAGIPAYEILTEKLGLTQKQLQNLGKEAIPANIAINALVDGMQERFGRVIDQSSLTMQGILSNLADNSTMLTAGLFEPLIEGFRVNLGKLGNVFQDLRMAFETGGAGAVFEKLVPPALHGQLRALIANVTNLYNSLKPLWQAMKSILAPVLQGIVRILNMLLPVLTLAVAGLTSVARAATSNAAVMKVLAGVLAVGATAWAMFTINALAATAIQAVIPAIKGVAIAIKFLSASLTSSPMLTVFILLAAGLAGVAVASDKANNSLSSMFKKLTSFGGVDPDKVLLPSQKDRASDLDKFNQKLGVTGDQMDDLASSTGKANKAAKTLLSFDEAFKLNEPDEGADGAGLDLDGIFPTVGDVAGSIGDFATSFVELFKTKLITAGLGTIIGGIIGGIFGGPAGIGIGATIGTFVGWLWGELGEFLKLTPSQIIGMPVAGAIGAGIGFLMGGPGGALIGTSIGLLAGWIWGLFKDEMDKTSKALNDGLKSMLDGFDNAVSETFRILGDIATGLGIGITKALQNTIDAIILLVDNVINWAVNSLVGFYNQVVGDIKTMWVDANQAVSDGINKVKEAISSTIDNIKTTFEDLRESIKTSIKNAANYTTETFAQLKIDLKKLVTNILSDIGKTFTDIATTIEQKTKQAYDTTKDYFTKMGQSVYESVKSIGISVLDGFSKFGVWVADGLLDMYYASVTGLNKVYSAFSDWISRMWSGVFDKLFGWIDDAIDSLADMFRMQDEAKSSKSSKSSSGSSSSGWSAPYYEYGGHATGGIFNREHLARFAEGNKAEAIIPLENASAMQPFVTAIADGILQGLLPTLVAVQGNGGSELPPMYVGTLIGDERGLRELSKKFKLIDMQENARRGLV